MPASGLQPNPSNAALQLLLFVDRRPSSWEQLRDVRRYLREAPMDFDYDLEVIEVGDKPYLAEHFKLIATPALIKIHPKPQQTLAGSNLVAQLDRDRPALATIVNTPSQSVSSHDRNRSNPFPPKRHRFCRQLQPTDATFRPSFSTPAGKRKTPRTIAI